MPSYEAIIRTIADRLRELADRRSAPTAAPALMDALSRTTARDGREGRADRDAALVRAIDVLGDEADALAARWLDRLFDAFRATEAYHAAIDASRAAGVPPAFFPPALPLDAIVVAMKAREALRAAGPRRLAPLVGRLNAELVASQRDDGPPATARRENADAVLDVLAHAGPAIVGARRAILAELRGRGVWSRPSNLMRSVGRLAEFDLGFVGTLRKMLADPATRTSAIEALATIGVSAGDATPELLAFRTSENHKTRYLAIYAMAQLGPPTQAVLDAFEAAFADPNVEVRMAVTIALRERLPEPSRFVPRVIAMCDETEYVHDFVVPAEAVKTLAAYGPAAAAALLRLTAFLRGPIVGRTIDPQIAEVAIAKIAGRPSVEVIGPAYEPARRPTPIAGDQPLWPVTFRDRLAYVDARGEVALVTAFAQGGRFDGDRAIVHDDDYAAHVIDRRGEVVFRSEWDAIEPFREGRAAVKRGDRWGFVDGDGRVIVEPQYDRVTAFREGLAGVELGRVRGDEEQGIRRQVGLRGYIDPSGRVVIPIEIEHGAYSFREGLAPICTGGRIEPRLIDESKGFRPTRHGFIGRDGRLVFDGPYDMPAWFHEGLANVSSGNWDGRKRCGYVDRDGREVIPLEFKRADEFLDGLAVAQRRGRARRNETLVIDPRGNVVWSTREKIGALGLGLFSIWDGNAFGIVDRTGAAVVPPQFDRIEAFVDGLAEVERGAWYGLIDPTGRMVYGPVTGGRALGILESEWTR